MGRDGRWAWEVRKERRKIYQTDLEQTLLDCLLTHHFLANPTAYDMIIVRLPPASELDSRDSFPQWWRFG